jgi:two-component system nitrate/nitrite response regulator NarL
MSQIRILIVDDHPVIRDGLRALLATQADLNVVGTAQSGAEAIRLARELEPDIILLDYGMPGMSGLDVMREMKRTALASRTILFTSMSEEADISALLQLGIRGIVSKDSPMELIFKSIRKVSDGELWVDRETMGDLVESLATPRDAQTEVPGRSSSVTHREREVLTLVVQGQTNKRIAKRLRMAEDTVKHHLTSIFGKTGTSNRLELAIFAMRHRMVERRRLLVTGSATAE